MATTTQTYGNLTAEQKTFYDRTLLSRLLTNLISNAYRYGKPNGHVWVDLRREGQWAVLSVRDDGIGMSPEKARQILDGHEDSSADFFREIGVGNVQKRLRYEFGAQYGITIDSVEGEYTVMSIHIPECPPE